MEIQLSTTLLSQKDHTPSQLMLDMYGDLLMRKMEQFMDTILQSQVAVVWIIPDNQQELHHLRLLQTQGYLHLPEYHKVLVTTPPRKHFWAALISSLSQAKKT